VYSPGASPLITKQHVLDGQRRRRKLRLRWYDSLQPGPDFYLEVKWRDNRVTGKHRLQMRSSEPLSSLSYHGIRQRLEGLVPEPLQRDLLRFSEPILIVQYQREHFATDDGLRITLDYGITYYDQRGKHRISTAFPRRLEGLIVLEGKTPVGREAELRRWLHPFAPRATRCSKYVHGCSLLGHIRPSDL